MQIIKNDNQLADFCNSIKNEPYIAIDTEFMQSKSYYAELCLIQIASKNHNIVIDTIINTKINLKPLFQILLNKNITKVFHSAHQDLKIFYKIMHNNIPVNINDTQIMDSIINTKEQISYQELIKLHLNINLYKDFQLTQWNRRPLNQQQLEYAINDVKYLYQVYPILIDKINSKNRMMWLNEELNNSYNTDNFNIDVSEAYKKIKVRGMSPKSKLILKKISTIRELEAQKYIF